jgi:transcriptional regulator with XRE-family HTH domain
MRSSHKLPNYLRTHRKRAGFSQEEIAFLLGSRSGAHVCRYERFTRQPTLPTALAFEVIFQVPAKALFAGVYRNVERRVAAPAVLLTRKVAAHPERHAAAKLKALQMMAGKETVTTKLNE